MFERWWWLWKKHGRICADTFWEMLNIYDSVWRVKNAHLRDNGDFGVWYLIYFIRGDFFLANAQTVEHEMGATECHT